MEDLNQWNKNKKCWVSCKTCFNKKDAETAKNFLYLEKGVELRVYQCPTCNYWHLTHNLTFGKKNGKNKSKHKKTPLW